MKYRLQKAAVLGSGVMGSGIACHLANIGLDVLLLDIVPFDLSDDKKNDPAARNSIVNGALKSAIKNKPAALYRKEFSSRIRTGNFDDDFDQIADCDWIIEVVVERLDIKQQILAKVEQHRKAGSLVTSNTSSIPIKMLAEGRSEEFQQHFCGTHFFNPARYMPLLEIIPHEGTAQSVTDFFMSFGDVNLGKQTVLCKDTPGFIANRIGVMSGIKMTELTTKYDMRIEEVDAITGPMIGRPKTATYKLQDLVGIDTSEKVGAFVNNACKEDEFFSKRQGQESPQFIQHLIENKAFGRKSGKGFYQRTKEKDEKGRTIINALNLKTLKYETSVKPRLDIVGKTKNIEIFSKKLDAILGGDDRECQFLQEYFASLLSYAANRIPEISDDFFAMDDAMRTGYMWDYGPFEYWDEMGLERGIALVEAHGESLPSWIKDMQANGVKSFYTIDSGVKKAYSIASGAYEPLASTEGLILLDAFRQNAPIIKNSECTVHDIGDGVMCIEFTSKSNAIGEAMGEGIAEAIDKAESEGWNGIVIGNHATNFTVGANLMPVGMLAMQKDFETLEKMVKGFQDLVMRLRCSKIPVVAATQGYVFGGGCEMSMHCNATVMAAESYIGLVEVGVGLLPGGCGTKEMALRASDSFFEGDVQIPTLIEHFKPIATATVATSAPEAYGYNLLLESKDEICLRKEKNIARAKELVLEMAPSFIAPVPRHDVTVLGRTGLSALYTAINEFRLGEYMSDYDVVIARKVAEVMCGGDLTSAQQVSEQYLIDLEREAFLSLLGNQKTLDRIQYLLMNNKPLRN